METSILFPSDPDKISEKDLLQLRPFSTFNSTTGRLRDVWAIVAMNRKRAIGTNGSIPWHLPEDLRHFKQLTMGHPVVMGRKTWDSLPKRPLPGRRNMVISRNKDFKAEGAEVFSSIEEALESCRTVPFIIGGAEIYASALPYCTRIYITDVATEVENADAFFPELTPEDWEVGEESENLISDSGLVYKFITLNRK